MKKVSDYLREERVRRGLTIEEAARETKIKKEFLEFIEEGRFSSLPSRAYAIGFVKNYASYLGLSEKKIMAFFRRESLEEDLEVVPRYRRRHSILQKNFFSQQKGIFIILAGFIILGYIVFQYGSLLFGPQLTIESPKNGEILSENVVEVNGKTDQSAIVMIDGIETAVAFDGSFKKSLYVTGGEKKITIISKGRFGRESKEEITVKVQ